MRQAHEGERVWMRNVTNICFSMMQLHQACSLMLQELYGFMKRTKPFTLRLYMEVKCRHVVRKPEGKKKGCLSDDTRILDNKTGVPFLHPFLRGEESPVSNLLDLKHTTMHLHTENGVRHHRHMARCPAIPDPHSCPRCQKEDSPRLELVWAGLSQQSGDGALQI